MKEDIKNQNIFKKTQNFIFSNLRYLIALFTITFLSFISFQVYSYFLIQDLKKTSLNFFSSIDKNEIILKNLNDIKNTDNIFSTLSILKIIEKNNNEKNFKISNELYKEIIFKKDLNILYKSSIAAHASYTLINASYLQKTNKYIDDIATYINNIDDNLESYFSIKKELEYLLAVTEIDINNSNYKNNLKVFEIYNEIILI